MAGDGSPGDEEGESGTEACLIGNVDETGPGKSREPLLSEAASPFPPNLLRGGAAMAEAPRGSPRHTHTFCQDTPGTLRSERAVQKGPSAFRSALALLHRALMATPTPQTNLTDTEASRGEEDTQRLSVAAGLPAGTISVRSLWG